MQINLNKTKTVIFFYNYQLKKEQVINSSEITTFSGLKISNKNSRLSTGYFYLIDKKKTYS